MDLALLGVLAVVSFVGGALFGGSGVGLTFAMARSGSPARTDIGTVDLELSYTCHPEKLFGLLERDLRVLEGSDRVVLDIEATRFYKSSWEDSFPSGRMSQRFGPVHGTVTELPDALRHVLMDDDSPLIRNSRNDRQRGHSEIRGWSKRTLMTDRLSWSDSDSALTFHITGQIRNPHDDIEDEPTGDSEDEEARRAADAEVNAIAHKARISARHSLKEGL